MEVMTSTFSGLEFASQSPLSSSYHEKMLAHVSPNDYTTY